MKLRIIKKDILKYVHCSIYFVICQGLYVGRWQKNYWYVKDYNKSDTIMLEKS